MGLLRLLGIGRFFEYLVDKGVLYAKDSLGKDGVPFRAYKIRTMHNGADKHRLVIGEERKDPCIDCLVDGEGNPVHDTRRINGRSWLRRWGLDEWPQWFNILEGEMSLVGPRPREAYYWAQLEERRPGYMMRTLQQKPGIIPPERTCKNTGNLDDFINRSIAYLEQKEQHPVLTDVKYAARVLWAKYAHGVHGE